jgi:hypothetical protein
MIAFAGLTSYTSQPVLAHTPANSLTSISAETSPINHGLDSMDFSGCAFKSTSTGRVPLLVNSQLLKSARRPSEEPDLIAPSHAMPVETRLHLVLPAVP